MRVRMDKDNIFSVSATIVMKASDYTSPLFLCYEKVLFQD